MAVGLKASFHFLLGGGEGSDRTDEEPAPPFLGAAATVVNTVLSVVTAARRGMAGGWTRNPTHRYGEGGRWGRHRSECSGKATTNGQTGSRRGARSLVHLLASRQGRRIRDGPLARRVFGSSASR
ncbi:hypothetical protein E2562_021416 [Oryza meyeriana var. granulata]|uniref:Uncharacterized protein n=1 Tax=Oryza meyeriana var. granulata TaxID=110450 RepID=A0A6G1EXU7_9ORYZ|nr:hypothetical protein E2562_021416 [Oryza meyeriana var. granulata]